MADQCAGKTSNFVVQTVKTKSMHNCLLSHLLTCNECVSIMVSTLTCIEGLCTKGLLGEDSQQYESNAMPQSSGDFLLAHHYKILKYYLCTNDALAQVQQNLGVQQTHLVAVCCAVD